LYNKEFFYLKRCAYFFALNQGKKITKTQVFSSLREAQLHSKGVSLFFTSSQKNKRLACLSTVALCEGG